MPKDIIIHTHTHVHSNNNNIATCTFVFVCVKIACKFSSGACLFVYLLAYTTDTCWTCSKHATLQHCFSYQNETHVECLLKYSRMTCKESAKELAPSTPKSMLGKQKQIIIKATTDNRKSLTTNKQLNSITIVTKS